jgi:hypothetical protein
LGQEERRVGEAPLDHDRRAMPTLIGSVVERPVRAGHVGIGGFEFPAAPLDQLQVDQVIEHDHAVTAQYPERFCGRCRPI